MEGGLVEKEVHENIVSQSITQMLPQHVTCKIEIRRKSEALLSSVAKDKKVKRVYS